jgi:hypothetical protein
VGSTDKETDGDRVLLAVGDTVGNGVGVGDGREGGWTEG